MNVRNFNSYRHIHIQGGKLKYISHHAVYDIDIRIFKINL